MARAGPRFVLLRTRSRRPSGRRPGRGPWWLALLALALPTLLEAQDGVIRGRVRDLETGRPLAAVDVRVRGTDRAVLTNEAGGFRLTGLAAGTYWLEFRLLGYGEGADSVTLGVADVEVEVEVRLATRPVVLDAMTVTVRLGALDSWLASRGFSQRGLAGRSLLHTTHDEIARTPVRSLDDLLRRVPAVRVRRLVDGGGEIRLEPSPLPDGAPCRVSVYLNGAAVEFGRFHWTGVRWDQRASRPIRYDDLVQLGDIDGIELYGPGESPVAAEGACGALLLWSAVLRPQLDEAFTGAIRGIAVDDATGAAWAGVRVRLQPGGLEAVTGSAGEFTFPSLLPGDYELDAAYPGAEPWRGVLTVKAFGTLNVELRMERGGEPGTVRSGRDAGRRLSGRHPQR